MSKDKYSEKASLYQGFANDGQRLENENETFESEKKWLDQVYEWTKDKKFYEEKLKELKEKYGIKE